LGHGAIVSIHSYVVGRTFCIELVERRG